jgi:anti-sigma regulatory factor (Ser/Thr protein kinase)
MHMSRSSTGDVGAEPAEPHCDRVDLVAALIAVRDARKWTADRLARTGRSHSRDLIDAAVLVVSELVTNAVHAVRQPPARPPAALRSPRTQSAAVISLVVTDTSQGVRIEVHDRSCVPVPPVVQADAGDETGLGLIMMDALATGWGWRPSPYGRMVWCELDDGVVRAAWRRLVIDPPADLGE